MSVFTFLVSCIFAVSAQNFDQHSKLDENYKIWWSTDEDSITFQVEVATRGWVGFGISPNGGMEGSDVVIGWINDGKATFHDRYARGKFLPEIDEHQDWELLWYQQTDTHTKFRFKRFLIPCDSQDLNITDDTTRVIFAYNHENPSSSGEISYHGTKNRGTKSVTLKKYERGVLREDPRDLYHWETRYSNVRIPDNSDTEYYCKFFRVPELSRKHHIVKIDTLIEPGNEKFVHHMMLYECTNVETEKIAPYLNEEYTECYTKNKLPKFPFCFTITYGWAIGGDNFTYPDQAGLPLGIPEVKWLLLETHYDNPGLKKGIVDNSGFRITYTPKLRKHDAAVLAIGNLWYPCVFIPPKQQEYIVSGHAHPSCLRQRVPPEGIKTFASLLHSHTIGKTLKVRHFRNGEELLPLAQDLNYDFDFQQFKYLPEERTLLPNDHLLMECAYDSSRRAKVTFGGLSTREEMCMAFFGYYPRLNISYLTSCPSPYNILTKLGVKEMSDDERFVISPLTGKNQTYYEFLSTYPWDYQSVNSVQNAMRYGPQLNICADRGGKGILTFVLSRYPKVKKIHKEKYKCRSNK